MRPYDPPSAPPGLGVPPPVAATGVGTKAYSAALGSSPLSMHSTHWRDRSEESSSAASAGGKADGIGNLRSASPGSPAEKSSSNAPLSLSSFAAPSRALAAAVATPLANHTRRCLLDSLSSIVGKKLLLLDETLAGALSLLVDCPTLQQQGVDRCFPLRSYPLHASAVSPATAAASLVLFFCRPHLSLLPLIAHHINFIERTYAPTRPQAAAAKSPDASAAGNGGGSKSSSAEPSNFLDGGESTERDGGSRTQKGHVGETSEKETSTPLASRFPVPTSFSPSGRHYFVVCIPAASDFFTSEFRRLLASGLVPPLSPAGAAVTAYAGGACGGGAPGAGFTLSDSGEQQQEASASGSTGVAASLFSNLSNLPANLFGGSGGLSSQAGAAGTKQLHSPCVDASTLPPPLSQGSATVTSCPLFFFPLAQDLLSLELSNSYRDLHLYGDKTPIQLAAAAILLVQEQLLHGGLIPQLRSLGSAAKAVADQLIQYRKEREAQETEQQQQQHLAPYGPAAVGGFLGKPGGFFSGGEGGGLGGPGLSHGAAAVAARAYRSHTAQGDQKYAGDAGLFRVKEGSTPSGDSSGKRLDPPAPPENSELYDSQNGVEASPPLPPLAPPTRFVLSRDDFTLEGEEEAEDEQEEHKGLRKRGSAPATHSNAGSAPAAASAARKDRGATTHCARDRRLSSTDRSEEGCSPRRSEGDFQAGIHRPAPRALCEFIPVDMLILIDRRSDLITPLCTAFTYEALLDAVFGIDAAAVDVPQQLLLQQPQQHQATPIVAHADGTCSGRSGSLLSFTPFFGGEKETETRSSKVVGVPVLLPVGPRRRISLAGDGLYALLRDLHQSAVGARLHSIASSIQQTYKEKDALRSIQEISVFISKFRVKQKEHSSLSLHVRLASFLAAVTQDPAFVRRLALEDELLQSGVSSSSSTPPLKSSIVAQFEALLEDTTVADRLWWAPDTAAVEAGKAAVEQGYKTQQRMQQVPGISSSATVAAAVGVGNEGSSRWRGTAAACSGLVDLYRLLCLASLVNGGVRSKQMDGIRAGLLQHFGFEEVQRLALLHHVGLLRQTGGATGSAAAGTDKRGAADGGAKGQGIFDGAARGDAEVAAAGGGLAPGTWKILKRECNLLTDGSEGDQAMMDSIAYACSGYAPLSVRLIELLFEHASGWRAIPHLLSLLWGPAMEVRQQPQPITFGTPPLQPQPGAELVDVFAMKGETIRGGGQLLHEQEAGGPSVAREDIVTVLLFFLGGITLAEVAAIRRLNELELQRYHQRRLQSCARSGPQTEDSAAKLRRFVILTTEVTNAKKLIESCKVPAHDTCGRFRWSPCICSEDSA